MQPVILVTGGGGYIGVHACVALIEAGYTPLVLDNLCNGSAEALRRIGRITGRQPRLIQADVRDAAALDALFSAQRIEAVMHFAGLKAVGESTVQPLRYYDHNVGGSITLLEAMQRAGVRNLIFSSSATVYGEPGVEQFREDMRCDPVNPYGRSKWMIEQILADLAAGEPGLAHRAAALLQPGGRARERPGWRGSARCARQSDALHHPGSGGPAAGAAHIRRRLAHTRRQRRARLHPRDGPGRRPRGRLAPPAGATAATADAQPRPRPRHLGAGAGACFRAGQRPQPALHDGRSPPRRHRPASPPPAGPTPPGAAEVLGWRTQRDLDAMCRDAWCWQQANPDGYGG